ncbi:hypothetical protein MRB53_006615 [Persea americana]|uniref:Uncharacterized protein n=1 Tax=Persea americana TaxID=3435 RepID=A0ACC2MIA4_PERAE|nr:hypothetical protein MRB53_006615 [Persea americana]
MVLDKSYPLHTEAQLMVEVELIEFQCGAQFYVPLGSTSRQPAESDEDASSSVYLENTSTLNSDKEICLCTKSRSKPMAYEDNDCRITANLNR